MRWLAVLVACACACSAPAAAPDARDAAPDAPVWSTCAGDPRATPESLAAKAAAYDARVIALHVHPQMPWVLDVAIAAGRRSGDGDRAATSSRGAAARTTACGARPRARRRGVPVRGDARSRRRARRSRRCSTASSCAWQITGVPGLFTRELIPPGVAGIACPTDPAQYAPSPDKTRTSGCGSVRRLRADRGRTARSRRPRTAAPRSPAGASSTTSRRTSTSATCSRSARSRASSTIRRCARSPSICSTRSATTSSRTHGVRRLGRPADAVGQGLSRRTRGDTPGYLAVLGASFLATAADGTGDADLATAYAQLGYASYLDQIELWPGADDCTANWNDISMLTASVSPCDRRATRRSARHGRRAFERESRSVGHADGHPRQHNAWYDLMWAAQKPLGPAPTVPRTRRRGCGVRSCASSRARTTSSRATRRARAATRAAVASASRSPQTPFSIADRCAATFAWWGNPYDAAAARADPTLVQNPARLPAAVLDGPLLRIPRSPATECPVS